MTCQAYIPKQQKLMMHRGEKRKEDRDFPLLFIVAVLVNFLHNRPCGMGMAFQHFGQILLLSASSCIEIHFRIHARRYSDTTNFDFAGCNLGTIYKFLLGPNVEVGQSP